MKINTQEEFAEAVRMYIAQNQLSTKALANRVGKDEKTVRIWKKKGVKNPASRQKIVEQYPWLFGGGKADPYPENSKGADENKLPESARKCSQNVCVLMKIELARQGVVILADILQWFVSASSEERENFRASLGNTWKNFLELTRGMTGEHALDLALKEGRLKR